MLLGRELAHLPLSHLKGVSMPALVVIDRPDANGLYYRPRDGLCAVDDDHVVSARHGVIVCNDDDEACVTHEFRHHLQAASLRCPLPGSTFWYDGSTGDYWREIRRYFTVYPHERDALLYEARYCPTDLNRWWADAVRLRVPR